MQNLSRLLDWIFTHKRKVEAGSLKSSYKGTGVCIIKGKSEFLSSEPDEF